MAMRSAWTCLRGTLDHARDGRSGFALSQDHPQDHL